MLKAFFRSAAVQAVLAWCIAGYITLVDRTTRWRRVNMDVVTGAWSPLSGCVGAFWHRSMLLAPAVLRGKETPTSIVISLSPDGAFIARSVKLIGINVIRGSARNKRKTKSKGGLSAARESRARIEQGHMVAMTPDGPRGPRMRANLAAIRLAQRTQTPIIAAAVTTRWRLVFKSWDRFVLPLPFGPGVMVGCTPLEPPPENADADMLEHARLALETQLNTASQEAERLARVTITKPAEIEKPSASLTAPSTDASMAHSP